MISMIAAVGKNNELGKENGLIWHIPSDLKFFKEQTAGSVVAMGKNTFDSLPKMLPGRKHLILSFDDNFNKDVGDSEVYHDKETFISRCREIANNRNVFIIGGASIYDMFIDICDRIILTEINAEDKTADVYFPSFNKNNYRKIIMGENFENGVAFRHVSYEK